MKGGVPPVGSSVSKLVSRNTVDRTKDLSVGASNVMATNPNDEDEDDEQSWFNKK